MKNFWVFFVLFLVGCLPPSGALATEGTMRAPVGSTSGSAALAYTGDYAPSGTGGLVGGARVSHQVVRNVAVGGEAALGGTFRGQNADAIVAGGGRASVRVSPDSDHVAFTGGVGGGVLNSGLGFLTMDVGVRVGWNYQRRFEIFAGETVSATVSVPPPRMGDFTTPAYFHSITEIGLLGRPTERLALGAALDMMVGINSNGGLITSRPVFIPGVFATYTFGGN